MQRMMLGRVSSAWVSSENPIEVSRSVRREARIAWNGLDSNQLGDASRDDPLRDEDIAIGIEAGVVRMDKAAGLPLGTLRAEGEVIAQDSGPPSLIITKVIDHSVIAVEKRDSSVEIRDQHELALSVDVGRKEEAALSAEVLAVHVEPLEALVGTISND